MGRYSNDSGGGDFQQAPMGSHVARCIRLIDLGTQTGEYQGKTTYRNQVLISWELCHELMEYEDENKQIVQKPFIVSKFYTNSLGEKANLRHDLKNWRGKDFTPDELKKFDLQSILGASCILSVVHNEKGKAKVESVIKLTKGADCPPPVNKTFSFWLDEFDQKAFEDLSKGIKEIIMKSPEYDAAIGKIESPSPAPVSASVGIAAAKAALGHGNGGFDNFDDDIPF